MCSFLALPLALCHSEADYAALPNRYDQSNSPWPPERYICEVQPRDAGRVRAQGPSAALGGHGGDAEERRHPTSGVPASWDASPRSSWHIQPGKPPGVGFRRDTARTRALPGSTRWERMTSTTSRALRTIFFYNLSVHNDSGWHRGAPSGGSLRVDPVYL